MRVMMSVEGAQMPRSCPPEFRRKVLRLLKYGRFIPQVDVRLVPGLGYRSGVAGGYCIAFVVSPAETFGRR
jgi:hypothetical protein